VVKRLEGKSSSDLNEIPANLIKPCIKHIKKSFIHICNTSLKFSIYPDRLKTAKVKPHYEKGNIHDVLSYRPISFLSV
jgi:hypothetical protein